MIFVGSRPWIYWLVLTGLVLTNFRFFASVLNYLVLDITVLANKKYFTELSVVKCILYLCTYVDTMHITFSPNFTRISWVFLATSKNRLRYNKREKHFNLYLLYVILSYKMATKHTTRYVGNRTSGPNKPSLERHFHGYVPAKSLHQKTIRGTETVILTLPSEQRKRVFPA